MNTKLISDGIEYKKTLLQTLWIFVLLNYLYCDVLSLMDASVLKDLLQGSAGSMQFTPGFMLGAAVLMEIPIGMILLARVLNYRANRWANIIAGTIMSVVQFASLFVGTEASMYYIFYSVIEIGCTLFIVWQAWNWKSEPQGNNLNQAAA